MIPSFQIMRGICIISVVLTHIILKKSETIEYDIWIQNLINIAVSGFVFLSGYFINIEKWKADSYSYLKKRITRLLIPYLLWSLFYICYNLLLGKDYSFLEIIKILALGKVAGPLYYLVVLLWLTLFTPFVLKKMDNKYWNVVFFLITPLSFLFLYYYQLNIGTIYFTGALFPTSWFVFYYLGLKWQKLSLKISYKTIIAALLLGYFLELIETYFILNFSNDMQFATTPLRFFPLFYIIPFLFLFLKIKYNTIQYNTIQYNTIQLILKYLGDNSFGIYLCHIFFLGFVRAFVMKIINIENHYIIYVFTTLALTLGVCSLIIMVSKKVFPKKFLSMIGFS